MNRTLLAVLFTTLAVGPVAFAAGKAKGHFPAINRAMAAIKNAENALEKAEHDFGGHRAKALELCKQAENELVEAKKYAEEHPEEMKKDHQTK